MSEKINKNKCLVCKKENKEDAKFCFSCGNKIEKEAKVADIRKCPFCAEEIMTDAVKCKHCNTSLYRKKPWLAALLNIIIPGLGYLYIGKRVVFGVLLVISEVAALIWMFIPGNYELLENTAGLGWYYLAVIFAVIAFALDAYNTAKEVK